MPLLTKTSSAFVIFGCCEFNAQLLTNETHEGASLRERFLNVQWPQVFGFACFSFYNAPLMHTYYRVTLAQKWPLVPRIAANCLVVDPANFSVAILISSANKAISKGHDISTACSLAVDTWKEKFVNTLAAGLTCWPAAHMINNWLVPHRYRVLFFNIGSLCWNSYLTYTLWMYDKEKRAKECGIAQNLVEVLPTNFSSNIHPLSTAPNEKSSGISFCAQRDTNDLKEKDLRDLFGTTYLLTPNGEKMPISSLAGKNIGLYFSGQWCPPCRQYTPCLSKTCKLLYYLPSLVHLFALSVDGLFP